MRTGTHICAAFSGLLVWACGRDGNVGYTSKPACLGEETVCEITDEMPSLDHQEVASVYVDFLEELSPARRMPLDERVSFMGLAGGSDGTVWVVAGKGSTLLVRQFDAEGALSSAELSAPSGVVGHAGPSYPELVTVVRGAAGPVLSVLWTDGCRDHEQPTASGSCPRREIIEFQGGIEEPSVRTRLDAPRSDAASMFPGFGQMLALRGPQPGEYFVLGPGPSGWTAGRIDAQGEVAWQQGGFARLHFVGDPAAAATFTSDAALSIVGELDSYAALGLALLELDWATGNVAKRGHLGESFLSGINGARTVRDAKNRLVVAAPNEVGDLAWNRVDGSRAEQVRLLRSHYTFLSAIDLDVDTQGASYVLTASGPRTQPVATLCRMSDGGQVTCALARESDGGDPSTDPRRFELVAGNDGQVFVLAGGNELLRYDLPVSP